MKYLAILRDSFLEAVDSKVIYVLIPLSLLVTLFVLSISFTPGDAKRAMDFNVRDLPLVIQAMRFQQQKDAGVKEGAQVRLEDLDNIRYQLQVHSVEVVSGQPDSPNSTYRITVSRGERDFGFQMPGLKMKPAPITPELALAFAKKRLDTLDRLKIFKYKDLQPVVNQKEGAKPGEPTFSVTLEPAEATRRMWPHEVGLFFGAIPIPATSGLGFALHELTNYILWIGSLVTMLTSIIITAFFIPNMLRKGTVDLLIVKPIHRWVLLVYKYIGGLTFVFLNTLIAMLGIWLALGLKSGVWANGFMLMILIYTFFFAILYSVSTLFAVMTRSAIVAMMVTCFVMCLLFILSWAIWFFDLGVRVERAKNTPEQERWTNSVAVQVIRAIHFVLPRTSDIDAQGRLLLEQDFKTEAVARETTITISETSLGENLTVSFLFIAVMLGISCWWFSTKDY